MSSRWRMAAIALIVIAMNACQYNTEPVLHKRDIHALPITQSQAKAGLQALLRACVAPINDKHIYTITVAAELWQYLCAQAARWDPDQADMFFTSHFDAYDVTPPSAQTPLLTGYYAPSLRGSLTRSAQYPIPIYALPPDQLRTAYDRAAIDAGALDDMGLEQLYLDDAIDAFFLHIQGSGLVTLDHGETVMLRYAGKNDKPYTAIGKAFIDDDIVDARDMSAQWLTRWLRTHPAQAQSVMQRNASYVFFTLDRSGDYDIKGAQGTALTPMHSLAIDPEYLSYGVPVWLETSDASLSPRLAITQDTGSAIKGAVRADLFTGTDAHATSLAGRLRAPLSFTVLVPKDGLR